MSKLISTFKIGFDDETKAEISALKVALDAVRDRLKAGNIMPTGGLLAAMQDTAANDAEPELKQLEQWVFEGQDEKWVSAHVDKGGSGYYSSLKKSELEAKEKHWGNRWGDVGDFTKLIGLNFDTTNCRNSAIDRETINDVDYLSETVPEIQGMDAREIIIDELWPDKPAPPITDKDMQLIFIKNLSEVLVQRMHSMDRFSEDDYTIGGNKLVAWDIVFDDCCSKGFGVVTGFNKYHQTMVSFFKQCSDDSILKEILSTHTTTLLGKNLRTITEAELPAFRAALEACYA